MPAVGDFDVWERGRGDALPEESVFAKKNAIRGRTVWWLVYTQPRLRIQNGNPRLEKKSRNRQNQTPRYNTHAQTHTSPHVNSFHVDLPR